MTNSLAEWMVGRDAITQLSFNELRYGAAVSSIVL